MSITKYYIFSVLIWYIYTVQVQFNYNKDSNEVSSVLCLSNSNLFKQCYTFILNFTRDNSVLYFNSIDNIPFKFLNASTFNIGNQSLSSETELIPIHIYPEYIYDPNAFNFHKSEPYNLISEIKNIGEEPKGILGLGTFSTFLSYYMNNFNISGISYTNGFSFVFITDEIGKILIGEHPKFKFPKSCVGKITGTYRTCDFSSYLFNQNEFNTTSGGELIFSQENEGILLEDSIDSINKINQLLVQNLSCIIMYDIHNVTNYFCKDYKKILRYKYFLDMEFDNNFTLKFEDIFTKNECKLKTIISGTNSTKVTIGFDVMKHYKMDFSLTDNQTNHLITFERIYINKSWNIEIYSLLYGVLFTIVMLSAQIYIMVKS